MTNFIEANVSKLSKPTLLLKQKEVDISVDENGLIYVSFKGNVIFVMTFEETYKPIVFYEGKQRTPSVSVGIICKVMPKCNEEFNSSCFADSRDDFDTVKGCFLSFKKLYSSLVKRIIDLFNLSNEEANNVFFVVRNYLENCPIPVYKSKFYYV